MKCKKTDPDLRDWTYEEEKASLLSCIELSVEVSESNLTLEEIIEIIQLRYPSFYFDRTETRYQSCLEAVFIYQP